jgi:hypothetical protein
MAGDTLTALAVVAADVFTALAGAVSMGRFLLAPMRLTSTLRVRRRSDLLVMATAALAGALTEAFTEASWWGGRKLQGRGLRRGGRKLQGTRRVGSGHISWLTSLLVLAHACIRIYIWLVTAWLAQLCAPRLLTLVVAVAALARSIGLAGWRTQHLRCWA